MSSTFGTRSSKFKIKDLTIFYGDTLPDPSSYNDGDLFINASAGEFFIKHDNVWKLTAGASQGPMGYSGSTGYVGSRGITAEIFGTLSDPSELPNPGGFIGQTFLIDNELYIWTENGWLFGGPISVGYVGSQGPMGTRGYTGSFGYTGSRGYTGSQGYTGSMGASINIIGELNDPIDLPPTGNLGDAYLITGDLWVWDSVGPWTNVGNIQGPLGYTGSQGPIGYTGSQGDIGFTGSRGPIGYTGSRGFSGSQGPIGYTGSIGFTGSQGDIGYTGSQGPIGFVGSRGIQGVTGFVGSQGDQGIVGNDGPIGFTGSFGYTGSQGVTGYVGSQGPLGYTGSQGDIGFTGSQGIQGIQGPLGYTGSQGPIGYTGSQGTTGTQGLQGLTGYTGSAGPSGASLVNNTVSSNLTSSNYNLTLPSTAGLQYIIRSIHVANVSAAEATVNAFLGISSTYYEIGKDIPLPSGTSLELLKKSKVLNPSGVVRLTGAPNNTLNVTTSYETVNGTEYVTGGVRLTTTTLTNAFVAAHANGISLESILLTNYGSANTKVRIVYANASNVVQGTLAYELIIPKNATVELLEGPKFLQNNFRIRAQASDANSISVVVAGKKM